MSIKDFLVLIEIASRSLFIVWSYVSPGSFAFFRRDRVSDFIEIVVGMFITVLYFKWVWFWNSQNKLLLKMLFCRCPYDSAFFFIVIWVLANSNPELTSMFDAGSIYHRTKIAVHVFTTLCINQAFSIFITIHHGKIYHDLSFLR